MAKQLNTVNLTFNADTGKARQQLMELQKMLDSLVKGSVSSSAKGEMPITKQLTEAQVAASKLQTILKQTTNVNTGNLDLTRFSESLNKSGLDLKQLQGQLNSLGADGQKAFISLASSIVSADVPLTRTSKLVTELWTTLKNTARWQLSSSMLHGFMGTIQSAYGYAQDLDQSLNNIRIVTGQNVEEMARFAEQANKAAKALSTTTTNYTDASLIYYQQGLDENQVAERTEVTIKMANAAGQSAEVVSDQLTAVWNNFYDGSKSLEYYADVMTALGAATASSTDEIAGGLEKFAAVADTIGLSYEYAASALATITSNTRQSEEVVGTALKTIFARIQGLNLGETLDDGTTLNKYSEALDKVGISIFNQAGEIKAMDDILDEMGSKWDTMAKDQQIALAQTVAGVRQYNQLVSLMDNWDAGDSDSMMANLETAYGSTGALTEQADIYAESWQAARDRVKAAAEDIYDSILDEKFFIGMLDGFETVLSGVGNLIDSLGGLPGILSAVGVIMTRVFSKQIAQSINNIAFGVESLSGKTRKTAEEMKQDVVKLTNEMQFDTGTEAGDRAGAALKDRLLLTQQIQEVSEHLTAEEREQLVALMKINDAYAQQAIAAAELLDKEKAKAQEQTSDIRKNVIRSKGTDNEVRIKDYQKAQEVMQNFANKTVEARNNLDKLNTELSKDKANDFNNSISKVTTHLRALGQTGLAKGVEVLWQQFKTGDMTVEQFKESLSKLVTSENLVSDSIVKMGDDLHKVVGKAGVTIQSCDNLGKTMINVADATNRSNTANTSYQRSLENLQLSVKGFKGSLDNFGTNITTTMQSLSSLVMGISSLKSAFDTLKNPDLSFGEKLLQVTMSLTMAIPALISALRILNVEQLKKIKSDIKEIGLGAQKIATNMAEVASTWLSTAANKAETGSVLASAAAWVAKQLAMAPVLVITLAIVAAIGAVIAISAGLIAVVGAISDAYNKDALAAERAQEAAKNLASEYENTKQAYEEMISAMDNYKSATDALENMTKGTEEYRDALREANEAALDLIAANNLTKEDYNWEDGQLKIEQEALDRVKEEQSAQVSEAYAASQMANVRASEAQNQADFTQIKRDMVSDSLDMVTGTTATTGQTAEALQKALDYMAEKGTGVLDDKDLIQSELEINDQGLINALYENRGAIEELSSSIESADALREAATQQAANEIMAGEGYEETQAGRAALEAGGRVYEAKERAAYDKYMKTNLADLEIGTAAGKQLWKDYAKEAGLEDLDGLKLDYENDRVKYEYIDEEGNKQEKEVTKEEMAQVLAAADAAGELKSSMETLRTTIGNLTSSADNADKALAEFLQEGDFGGATKAEYDAAKNAVTGEDGEIDTGKVNEYLGLTGDVEKDNALAVSYGYADAEAYRNAFTESLNLDWEIPEGFSEAMSDKLTADAADKINQNMSELGNEGGATYAKMMNQAMEKIDWNKLTPEEDKEATEALANVDVSAWDAADQIVDIVNQYGDAVGLVTEEWKANEKAIRSASGAVFDVDSWKGSSAEKQSVASGLKTGDTIDAEEYNKLGAAYSQFFQLQNDGTYKLVAAAEDLQSAVQAIETQKMLENIQSENTNIQAVEGSKEDGGSGLSTKGAQNLVDRQLRGEDIGAAQTDLDNYKAKVEEVYDVECASIQEAIDIMQQHNTSLQENQNALLLSSTSLEEFQRNVLALNDALGYVDYNAYSSGLLNLASNYENCSGEAERYSKVLVGGTKEQKDNAAAALETAIYAGELAEQYDFTAEELELYADELKASGKYAKATDKELIELAKDQKRFDRAVQSAQSNISKWNKDLKVAEKTGHLVSESAEEMAEAYGDLLDIDGSELSSSFLRSEKNLKNMKKALEGSEEAYQALQEAAGKDILTRIGLDTSQWDADFAALQAKVLEVEGMGLADIEAGASLNNAGFLNSLTEMVNAAGMTAQEATDYLSSMGVDAEVITEPEEVKETQGYNLVASTGTVTQSYIGAASDGTPQTLTASYPTVTYDAVPVETTKTVAGTALKVTSAAKSSGGAVKHAGSTPANGGSNSKKGKGGGGGGGSSAKPEKVDKTKKSDVVERYKEIEDKLDDVRNAMEDASRAADRLYGANRIKKMKDVSKQLEKEVKLLNQKKEEAEEYLEIDKKALKNAAKDVGLTFKFDDEGNISNYEAQMEKLYNKLAKAEAKADPKNFKTKEAQDAYIEKNVTPLKEKIEALKEAIEQYDETRELIEDLDDEAEEKFNEWQDNNFEILNYELELKLEVDDSELRRLEYLLSKIEDDFYSMAEAAALMIGTATTDADGNVTGLDTTGSQLKVYEDQFADLQAQRDALKTAYQNGEISEAQYVEGLQDLEDKAYDNAEAIQELDKTMMHYYGDTLEAAADELAQYTDMMEQHVEVLEHYANIMDIIGKSTDYESMGVILEAQAQVAENQKEVSKANYEMLNEQRNARKAEYEAALNSETATDAEIAMLKQKWLDAEAAANDAQDQMLADTEAWAEALRAVVENKLAGLSQALEDALTADFGGSFDQMAAQMERAASLQEEYLTDTNKIYETNKLINKAQQDIDKTTNTVAKKRLQSYIQETEQLQNKNKLSNYELEIQQAKYDLILAEIALEEAQNAKSTVRLQRDAEGNFGYVYTADQNKVAEAEQELADAQNRLYNIGLEGANSYTEKYQQTLSEMYDTLTELQTQYLEGAFASEEEYNQAVDNAKAYYYEKLEQYSELYGIALTTDMAIREDAWGSSFEKMTLHTDDWQAAVTEYLGNVKSVFAEWEEQVKAIREETIGPDLDALKEKTEDITTANEALEKSITKEGGVLDGIEAEIEEVNKLTAAYIKAKKSINGTTDAHETFIKSLRESIENPEKDKKKKQTEEPKEPEQTPKETDDDKDKNVDNSDKAEGVAAAIWIDGKKSGWGNDPGRKKKLKEKGVTEAQTILNTQSMDNLYSKWINRERKKYFYGSFDTGGYTGAWGPQGKLAILHEKELVLNKQDTQNFLASMDLLDKILQTIDLQAMSSQIGGFLSSPTLGQMKEEFLEQHVTIEANFPGVSMASEIEEAFENIVNLASQYANRK